MEEVGAATQCPKSKRGINKNMVTEMGYYVGVTI
jgi:hypothetical protein